MRHFTRILPGVVMTLLAAATLLGSLGCDGDDSCAPVPTEKDVPVKKIPVGKKNVTLVIQGERRYVMIDCTVCLREGALEQLLTRKGLKEHEAILAADVDARDINQALILTGAEAGSPVVYQPKFKPPTGPKVKISVQWEEKGKLRTEPAQKWVMNGMTKKELASDWVYGGSKLVKNFEEGQPPVFLANDGDVICVANFESALLDVPFDSTKADADRFFVAFTERIPPKDTKVTLILEPVIEKKSGKSSEKK